MVAHAADWRWPMALAVGCVVAAVATGGDAAPAADFSVYQKAIIDRKPFGEPVLTAAAGGPGGKPGLGPGGVPQGSFITELRMCAIMESPEGLRVGIENTKAGKSYLFSIGDTLDEITLVDADYVEECALLRKGTEEYWISIKGDGTQGQDGSSVSGSGSGGGAGASGTRESYAERLRKRREALRTREVEAPKMNEEELQQHLQQYQMELIRAGGDNGPPLPIQLTPEMDDQLVAEGVLPPVE